MYYDKTSHLKILKSEMWRFKTTYIVGNCQKSRHFEHATRSVAELRVTLSTMFFRPSPKLAYEGFCLFYYICITVTTYLCVNIAVFQESWLGMIQE